MRTGRLTLFVLAAIAAASAALAQQDIDREPILYGEATPRNAVAEFQRKLSDGTASLDYDPDRGYLRPVLKALDIPESSQVLVFSKTSLQRQRISPKTPRAIYFNDDVMVGFCLRGDVMELSAADDAMGTTFYTLDQMEEGPPTLRRQTESCLICHGSSANRGIPGHLVRSVFTDRQGVPILSGGSYRTDHTSPLEERWGGWYVTGRSGKQSHLGNRIGPGPTGRGPVPNPEGINILDLKDRFTTGMHLTPHSDIVALMVLEHQVGMHNRLARANLETRMALHYQREMNKALGRPLDHESESAWRRIHGAGDDVVRYMLFRDEAPPTDRVEGTSTFAAEFSARGPRDSKGRSLRDLDLHARVFRLRCSYQIYSRAFDALPAEVKGYIYRRLWDILNGRGTRDDPKPEPEEARAILEILLETRSGLPDYWKPAPEGRRKTLTRETTP
jgi:hypothetical protein